MSVAIIPTAGRVLISADLSSNPSSLLHIPKEFRDKCLSGRVVAVGPDVSFQVDQRLIIGAYSGVKFKAGKQDYVIVRADEVHGVIADDGIEVTATEA